VDARAKVTKASFGFCSNWRSTEGGTMKSTQSAMADTVVAWLERFELNELKNKKDKSGEKETSLIDATLLEISRRGDRARRREEWIPALRHGQLALDLANDRPGIIKTTGAAAEKAEAYSEAVTHLYAGALGLARSDIRAALGHFRLSKKIFGDLEQRRAECIACAAVGIAYARRRKWADALEAYRKSIALIDQLIGQMAPLNSSLKELRTQIMHTVPMILDYYEQKAGPDDTRQHQYLANNNAHTGGITDAVLY
jgi:tetratricopeptide (TPR) repeat protein